MEELSATNGTPGHLYHTPSRDQGLSWEKDWEDCKSQRLKGSRAKQHILNTIGLLHP